MFNTFMSAARVLTAGSLFWETSHSGAAEARWRRAL